MLRTIMIEAPSVSEQEDIRRQIVNAQIQAMNMHMVSRWFSFDVDIQIVTQVLYLFPARAQMSGAANLSFFQELDEYEIELLVLERQQVSIHDIQTIFHPFSGWQWVLLLNYFDEGGEQNRLLRLNKAATCEKIVFPDGGYVLQSVVTERSMGCRVLMPVHTMPVSSTTVLSVAGSDEQQPF